MIEPDLVRITVDVDVRAVARFACTKRTDRERECVLHGAIISPIRTGMTVIRCPVPGELDRCTEWLGRRPGLDVPAVFLEHNAPREF